MKMPPRLKTTYWIALPLFFASFLIAACSSSGGVEGEIVSQITISLKLFNKNTGKPTNTVSSKSPGKLVATLRDSFGQPMANKTIQFRTLKIGSDRIGVILPQSGLGRTNSNGQATVQLRAGQVAGVGTAQATWDEFTRKLDFSTDGSDPAALLALTLFQVFGPNDTPPSGAVPAPGGGLMAPTDTLAAGSTGLSQASLTDAYGTPLSGETVAFGSSLGTITFESAQATTDDNGVAVSFFSVDPAATDSSGVVTATYNSIKDSAPLTITAVGPAACPDCPLVPGCFDSPTCKDDCCGFASD